MFFMFDAKAANIWGGSLSALNLPRWGVAKWLEVKEPLALATAVSSGSGSR